MKKLRVGFIGAGGMADAHLKGLSGFDDVQIAAFCDVVIERAQAQAAKYAAHEPQAYAVPSQMIADAGLDACYVLLPPFAHGDAERACIEGRVPFLVEKPIGKDIPLLRELRDEIERTGLMTAAGYMNRYQPSVQRAKEFLAPDEPVLAYGGWFGGPPLVKPGVTPSMIGSWWADKSKSGGQFVEQVTHTVDLARYFLGEAVEVFAHSTTAFNKKLPDLTPGYSIDDALVTSIKFENGAVATLMSSVATPVNGGIMLNVLTTGSMAEFSRWSHDVRLRRKTGDDVSEETVAGVGDIFAVEDRAFLDAVREGDPSRILSNYADAFQTARLAVAANQSAETGKPVDLND